MGDDSTDPASSFCSAVEAGDLHDAMSLALPTGLDTLVNLPNRKKVSPLMLSVLNSTSISATRWLLRCGASPHYVNADTLQTALHNACSVDNPAAVMSLLRAGALVDVADSHGRTPLHMAALAGSEYIAAKLLKYAGLQACRRLAANDGNTSLFFLHGGQIDFPSLLSLPPEVLAAYSMSALLNRPDAMGYTPLMSASEHGRNGMVAFLLSRRPDAGSRSRLGLTALELADWYGHAVVRAALEAYFAAQANNPPLQMHGTAGRAIVGAAGMLHYTDREAGLLGNGLGMGLSISPYSHTHTYAHGVGPGGHVPTSQSHPGLYGAGTANLGLGPIPVAGLSDGGGSMGYVGLSQSRDSTASARSTGPRAGAIPGGIQGGHGSMANLTPHMAAMSFNGGGAGAGALPGQVRGIGQGQGAGRMQGAGMPMPSLAASTPAVSTPLKPSLHVHTTPVNMGRALTQGLMISDPYASARAL